MINDVYLNSKEKSSLNFVQKLVKTAQNFTKKLSSGLQLQIWGKIEFKHVSGIKNSKKSLNEV